MPNRYDALPFNPFIHGTSSKTLSAMKSTDFQLMPVVAMLQNFKVAPMVGELTRGGLSTIGSGSNNDTITGAPAFGRMWHDCYDLRKILNNYTQYPTHIDLKEYKTDFKDRLKYAHNSAFSTINLLMIYLVRLRQLGVRLSDVVPLSELNTLKERLQATVQFYYFILCIQKYIFINCPEMNALKAEHELTGYHVLNDYIGHFFSFENFLEKLRSSQFDVAEVYNSPSKDTINKLLEFIKISKGSQERVIRPTIGKEDKEDLFIAKRDYHFFTAQEPKIPKTVSYEEMGGYLFTNNVHYSLANYLETFHRKYNQALDNTNTRTPVFPDFKGFHEEVLTYIAAFKERAKLCTALIDAPDSDFARYSMNDDLITKPFPIVFVTEAQTIEEFSDEYRSRTPLRLGRDIFLIATDTQYNQKRVRNYLQKNNIGPVEVLLFDDLWTLQACPDANYFDTFAHADLIKAFEIAKKQGCLDQFSKLYYALSELNEKRFRFKRTHKDVHAKLNDLFSDLQKNILTSDGNKINFKAMQEALVRNKKENYTLYATHRGKVLTLDTQLTILASLIVFYPITYLVQKRMNSAHTFFAPDTEQKLDKALISIENIENGVSSLGG